MSIARCLIRLDNLNIKFYLILSNFSVFISIALHEFAQKYILTDEKSQKIN